MQIHASCAARNGAAVLLLGPPGAGKSDLLLRLIDRGFVLVADDRVEIAHGVASSPPALAGLLELRGLGLLRLPHLESAVLALAIQLEPMPTTRLPSPERHPLFDLPLIRLDPAAASAAQRVEAALDLATGRTTQSCGAFAA